LSWTGPIDRVGTGGTDPLTEFILTMAQSVAVEANANQGQTSYARRYAPLDWRRPPPLESYQAVGVNRLRKGCNFR